MTPPPDSPSPIALYTNSRQKRPGVWVPFTVFLVLYMLAALLGGAAVLEVLR